MVPLIVVETRSLHQIQSKNKVLKYVEAVFRTAALEYFRINSYKQKIGYPAARRNSISTCTVDLGRLHRMQRGMQASPNLR